MKKIKNLVGKVIRLLCETVTILGTAGLIVYGYRYVFDIGVIPGIILFIITFAILAYKDRKSDKEKSGE